MLDSCLVTAYVCLVRSMRVVVFDAHCKFEGLSTSVRMNNSSLPAAESNVNRSLYRFCWSGSSTMILTRMKLKHSCSTCC